MAAKNSDTLTFTQQVDKRALLYLIENPEKTWPKLKPSERSLERAKLVRFFDSLDENGMLEVRYAYTNMSYRRMYGNKTNITSLSRKIRHTIAKKYNIDIDMKNCHPSLLAYLCEQESIPCVALKKYVQHRESILAEIERAEISFEDRTPKEELIAIINGGKMTISHPFVEAFYAEIQFIMDKIISTRKQEYDSIQDFSSNKRGKFLNKILISLEDQVLHAMIDHLQSIGVEITSLAFDGLTISSTQKKDFWKSNDVPSIIASCEKAIFEKLGARITLIEKPMKEGIKIPRTFEIEDDKRPSLFIPEMLKSTTHFAKERLDQKEYEEIISGCQFIFDTRSTGSGKTTNMMNHVKAFNNLLVCHHRISLDQNYIDQYPFMTSYQCSEQGLVRDNESQTGEKVSVVINSLQKSVHKFFGGDIHKIDAVCFDEIRSILRQTEMSGDLEGDILTLFDLIQYFRGPIFFLDANLTDEDIEFICSMRPGSSKVVLSDLEKNPQFSAEIFENSDLETFTMAVSQKLEEGKKLIIPYSCRPERIDGVMDFLKVKDFVNINRETRKEIDISAEKLAALNIFGFSPTWSEGVNFDSELFADWEIVSFIETKAAGPETCSQMMRRFRAVKVFEIHIHGNEKVPLYNDEQSYLRYVSDNLSSLCKTVSKMRVFDESKQMSNFRIVQDEFWKLHAKNKVEQELGEANFRSVFMQKLVNNKFQFDISHVSDLPDAKEMSDAQRDILFNNVKMNIDQRYVDMAAQPTISPEEYDALKSRCETRAEHLCAQKHYITSSCMMKEPSLEALCYFGEDRDSISKLRRMRRLLQFEEKVHCYENAAAAKEAALDSKSMEEAYAVDATLSAKANAEQHFENLESCIGGNFLAQKRNKILRNNVAYDFEVISLLKALGFSGFGDLAAKNWLNIEVARKLLTWRKLNKLKHLNYKKGLSQTQFDSASKSDSGFLGLVNDVLGVVGIRVICFREKFYQVCSLAYTKLSSEANERQDYALISDYNIDEEYARQFEEMFFWAMRRFECSECKREGPPNYFVAESKKWKCACGHKPNKKKVVYNCGKCGKDFGNKKYNYERHLATCGVEKKKVEHACEKCGKSFAQKSNLTRHLQSVNCSK